MIPILLAAHGSRDMRGNAEARIVADELAGISGRLVMTGFIEHAEPDLAEAASHLLQKGHREIVVAPCILAAAGHVKRDIPRMVNIPGMSASIARHLGGHPLLYEILRDRIAAKESFDTLLLVSRGSSDSEALAEIAAAAGELRAETAYMGVSRPLLPEALDRIAGRVLVLPYFLFSGLLMTKMSEIISGYPSARLAQNIGPDPRIAQILLERVEAHARPVGIDDGGPAV